MNCDRKRHPLCHPSVRAALGWPTYTGTATLVGTSSDGRTTVYYDASLGAQALANAKALVADAARVNALDAGFFGKTGKVNVILFALGGATDGTGGADHASCDYATGGNIEVCVAYGQDARVSALYEAELSECDMGGNLCGYSTGEALSRWCASQVSGNALSDFASAPTWAQQGYPNWVDQTDPSDQNYPSIGCGMAFLSWLQLHGFTLSQIAQTMVGLGEGGTLAGLYAALGGTGSAWSQFLAAVKALPGGVTSDDPFAGSTPTPPPPPPPPPPPTAVLFTFRPSRDVRAGERVILHVPVALTKGTTYDVSEAAQAGPAVAELVACFQ